MISDFYKIAVEIQLYIPKQFRIYDVLNKRSLQRDSTQVRIGQLKTNAIIMWQLASKTPLTPVS